MQKAKSSPVKSAKKGSPMKRAPTLEDVMPLEKRVTMLMNDPNVDHQEVEEYKRTELLRRSVTDVKMRAANDAIRRQSPSKTYSGVKSKVAGNMKSQRKAKKTDTIIAYNKHVED
jgi:predicted transposase YbfD/YdcC